MCVLGPGGVGGNGEKSFIIFLTCFISLLTFGSFFFFILH